MRFCKKRSLRLNFRGFKRIINFLVVTKEYLRCNRYFLSVINVCSTTYTYAVHINVCSTCSNKRIFSNSVK